MSSPVCRAWESIRRSAPVFLLGVTGGGAGSAPVGQHAVHHHAGLAEVVGGFAHRFQLRAGDVFADLVVGRQDLDQRAVFLDRLAAQVVHQVVCVFAAD